MTRAWVSGLAFATALFATAVGAQPAAVPNGSPLVAAMVAWAATDAAGEPFAIVDKQAAKVFVFAANGQFLGAAPVLLGLARGDENSPGIGDRPLSAIRPAERTTPAGRFEAKPDVNIAGHHILWLDYDAAISMHAVVTGNKADRRLERLQSASIIDNRISYGCINVPAAFFADTVEPTFKAGGTVYVLPDVRPIEQVFPALERFLHPPTPVASR